MLNLKLVTQQWIFQVSEILLEYLQLTKTEVILSICWMDQKITGLPQNLEYKIILHFPPMTIEDTYARWLRGHKLR